MVRLTRRRKMRGGINQPVQAEFNEEEMNILFGLGFDDGEIEMLNGIPLDAITNMYMSVFLESPELYGLTGTYEINDIVAANELSDLNIVQTQLTKHDIANDVIMRLFPEPNSGMDIEGGKKRRKRNRKSRGKRKSTRKRYKQKR